MVCGDCSSKKLTIKSISSSPIRVCDYCYQNPPNSAKNKNTPSSSSSSSTPSQHSSSNIKEPSEISGNFNSTNTSGNYSENFNLRESSNNFEETSQQPSSVSQLENNPPHQNDNNDNNNDGEEVKGRNKEEIKPPKLPTKPKNLVLSKTPKIPPKPPKPQIKFPSKKNWAFRENPENSETENTNSPNHIQEENLESNSNNQIGSNNN